MLRSALSASVLGLALLGLAAPSLAGPPAAIPDAGSERAGRAFDSFAEEWMQKMARAESQNRTRPTRSGGQYTYRGYESDFRTELKPTGSPANPYVGVLRYREHLFSCSDAGATSCSISATTPVTEIFRFQNGRWVY